MMQDDHMQRIIETGKDIRVVLTPKDVQNELYDICEQEHSGCNDNCPVYKLAIEEGEFKEGEANECPYFKNGRAMYERLRGKKVKP